MTVRLLSWNVNGIRSAIRKGFWDWLQVDIPDLLCLQETRIHSDQLTGRMRNPPGYCSHWRALAGALITRIVFRL